MVKYFKTSQLLPNNPFFIRLKVIFCQKDYLNDNSPIYTKITLALETVRVLQTHLADRWKDTESEFHICCFGFVETLKW